MIVMIVMIMCVLNKLFGLNNWIDLSLQENRIIRCMICMFGCY